MFNCPENWSFYCTVSNSKPLVAEYVDCELDRSGNLFWVQTEDHTVRRKICPNHHPTNKLIKHTSEPSQASSVVNLTISGRVVSGGLRLKSEFNKSTTWTTHTSYKNIYTYSYTASIKYLYYNYYNYLYRHMTLIPPKDSCFPISLDGSTIQRLPQDSAPPTWMANCGCMLLKTSSRTPRLTMPSREKKNIDNVSYWHTDHTYCYWHWIHDVNTTYVKQIYFSCCVILHIGLTCLKQPNSGYLWSTATPTWRTTQPLDVRVEPSQIWLTFFKKQTENMCYYI